MSTYICVFLGALALGLILTKLAIRVGHWLKIMDQPGLRKIHNQPIPRLGGPAIVFSMLPIMLCVIILDNTIGHAFQEQYVEVTTIVAGALFMFFIGLMDDCRGVRARLKFLAQLLAASAAWVLGLRIEAISFGDWLSVDLGLMGLPITILWIVAITNTVNLIDGLDGLAGGICTITCAVIVAFAIYHHEVIMAVLMLGIMGSLCGFLVFNSNPAKIFMGDSGTYFLGFMIATGSILSASKTGTVVGLALPALALGIPIFDMLLSIVRRSLDRRSWFAPDRGHIHHRLLEMGLRQRHAVIVMYAATALAAGLGMFMMITRDSGTLILLICIVILLLLLFRAVGLVRLRDVLAGVRRNLSISRQARNERRCFEEMQLQLREGKSFRSQWKAICDAAERLGFIRMTIVKHHGENKRRTILSHRSKPDNHPEQVIRMVIPLSRERGNSHVSAEIDISLDDSLESIGRRATIFGRLIDESGFRDMKSPDTLDSLETGETMAVSGSGAEMNPAKQSVA